MNRVDTFVVSFPECDSVSNGVVSYLSRRCGCNIKAIGNQLFVGNLSCSLDTLQTIIKNDKLLYRRKDGKISLRKRGRKCAEVLNKVKGE